MKPVRNLPATRRLLVAIVACVIAVALFSTWWVIIHEKASARTSTSQIRLENFSLSPTNSFYHGPYLSGFMVINGSAPLVSIRLSVNGTDEGVQPQSNGNLSNFVLWYKGGFQNPPIMDGHAYDLSFQATFQDGSIASARTVVIAG